MVLRPRLELEATLPPDPRQVSAWIGRGRPLEGVVIVGRALSVGAQAGPEVFSLCNTTWTNKTRANDEMFFNDTRFLTNTSFAFFEDACLFNGTLFLNVTESEWASANSTPPGRTPPPDTEEEALWEDMLFIGLLAISALVGTVGNAAVILAFCLYKKVRTTANTFILSTSFWDLVTSAVVIPLMITSVVTGEPNCGEACCAFVGFLSLKSVVQSMLSCTLIAFNRYVHVVLSVATYKRLFGPIKAFVWVAGSWMMCTLLMVPAISGLYGSFGWDAYSRVCQFSSVDTKSPLFYRDVLTSFYWVLAFSVSVFYIRIYLHVRKSTMAVGQHLGHSPQQVSLQAVKRTKHMFYIFFTFLILTCPGIVIMYIDFYGNSIHKAVFYPIIAIFYWNTAVNPIIYTWTLKEFRQGFKSMVRCRRQIVPNPPAAQPTVTAPRTSQLRGAVSRLTVSNQVVPVEPIATIPVVDT
ncbi:GPR50 [Branchiostoma lanceolatum]|uniref:GPR50 protein n=1 Tax=Branchiostoma lanceolatum TaxID=7740 RepID=A0A8K0ADH4_BRALA|nr:GPR50 [Branchiostoma lanceolatum]